MIVLVIDSSQLFIERWQLMLSEMNCVRVVYGAVSYKDAARLLKKIKVDLVLIDADLQGDSSINLLTEIKASAINTTVIILTNKIADQAEKKYRAIGADFFFDKYHEFEKIPGAVKKIPMKK